MFIFAMMKKVVILLIGLLSAAEAMGEGTDKVTTTQRSMYSWQAIGPLGTVTPAEVDTPLNGYNITDPALHRTIAFQSLGNAGSPGISKIFSDRKSRSGFLFFEPYSLYYTAPEDILYYNTKIPYANISYYNGGPTDRKQEHIGGVFSVNVTPTFNFGLYGKWQNNYGAYDEQSTRNYNGGLQGSYMGKHNNLMANISFNGYENEENGGFTDTRYITKPKDMGDLDAYNIPTYFSGDVSSKLVNWNSYLNYKYNFGFTRRTQVNDDSIAETFIPVSSIIYTFRNESDYKRYEEDEILNTTGRMATDSFYIAKGLGAKHNLSNAATNDSVHYWEMTHTTGLSLNEEFNTFGHFGIAGYLTYTRKEYGSTDHIDKYIENPGLVSERNVVLDPFGADSLGRLGKSIWNNTTRTKMGFGATISKHHGEHLLFNFFGEYDFKDEKKTNTSYNAGADISTLFHIGRNTFLAKAHASQKRFCPDYFEEHYLGNRISWDKDFDNKTNTELEGTIGVPSLYLYGKNDSSFISKLAPELGLVAKVNESNLSNYIYLDKNSTPAQSSDNISISRLTLREQLKIWYLHFDNEITYQYTNASEDVMDLPQVCLYSNLYLLTKPLFKVLIVQLGADMRYNSKYYAPAYMPATGLYYAQTEEKIGDYPYYDLYLNFHLKSFRVFLEYNHINNVWSNTHNYLVTPGYALDQDYFKFGLSVNFEN